MLFLRKTAPLAVLSLTLLSGASFSGAGFAFGTDGTDSQLTANTITIDTSVLAADAAARETALKPSGSDIIFTSGTGDTKPDAPILNSPEKPETPVNASSLAELVKSHGNATDLNTEMRCLAGAVYFESKGESLAGQLAVARARGGSVAAVVELHFQLVDLAIELRRFDRDAPVGSDQLRHDRTS